MNDKEKLTSYDQTIGILFEIALTSSNIEEENLYRCANLIICVFSEQVIIPYHCVAEKVYDDQRIVNYDSTFLDDLDDGVSLVKEKILELRKDLVKKDTQSILDNLSKLVENIRLSYIQKMYIMKSIQKLTEEIATKDIEIINLGVMLEESNKNAISIESRIKSITIDVVTVLGIFSALIFTLFGGFDTFSSSLASIANGGNLSNALILGAMLMAALVLIIVLMFELITYIGGKPSYFARSNTLNKNDKGGPRRYLLFVFSFLITTAMSGWVVSRYGRPIIHINQMTNIDLFPIIIIGIPLFLTMVIALPLFFIKQNELVEDNKTKE